MRKLLLATTAVIGMAGCAVASSGPPPTNAELVRAGRLTQAEADKIDAATIMAEANLAKRSLTQAEMAKIEAAGPDLRIIPRHEVTRTQETPPWAMSGSPPREMAEAQCRAMVRTAFAHYPRPVYSWKQMLTSAISDSFAEVYQGEQIFRDCMIANGY